jgi:hypothetical protein
VPFPVTLAVPTVVPPEVQVVGALGCGPKTLKVMVPAALEPEVEPNVDVIELVGIAVPTTPLVGPDAARLGAALLTANALLAGVGVSPPPEPVSV